MMSEEEGKEKEGANQKKEMGRRGESGQRVERKEKTESGRAAQNLKYTIHKTYGDP